MTEDKDTKQSIT